MSAEINLHKYGLKDFSRDDCEHCGRVYSQSTPIPGREKPLTLKIQCDACVEAERTIDQIDDVQRITTMRLRALDRNKDAEQLKAYQGLITRQRAKLKCVLDNIKKFTKEQSHSKHKPGTDSRLPYKE
jgi:hypothetical protein